MRKGAVRLQVVSRCPDVARTMITTDHGWHCSACDREVLDLRDVTRKQARELVARHDDPHGACISVRADAAGRSVFVHEAVASLKRAASGVAIAASLAACGAEPVDAPPVASGATPQAAVAVETPAANELTPAEPARPTRAPTVEPPESPLAASPAAPSASHAETECDPTAPTDAAPRRRVRRTRPGATSDVMGMTWFGPLPGHSDNPYDR